MILTQPGAWSAEPRRLNLGPSGRRVRVSRLMAPVLARTESQLMEVPDEVAPFHPKQPLGGPDGCRTRQHGRRGLKSTTGRS